jgi:ABC-type branched-subunit amino acid transport system substrate-binding protein
MRSRIVATCAVLGLLAVACGNSGSGKTTATTPSNGNATTTTVSAADLQKNIPLNGVQGVTNQQISVAIVTAKTNFLDGKYGSYADGIKAYFDYQNSLGGIYGRKLVIGANRDDNFLQDEQTVKASLAQDHAFATFIATPLFSGAPDIAATTPPMPTFLWNINPEMAGHDNIFGTVGALCFNCIGQGVPFLAERFHFTKVAILAYGVTASSKQCAEAERASFTKYPSAKVVFFDNQLQFAQADLSSDVGQIKAKGAQLVLTCIDGKESLILGKELVKQHVNAVQALPNGYDQKFVQENAQYLEGAFVSPQFVPFEYQPQLKEIQKFQTWMNKAGLEINELSTAGWIAANEFVTGMKLTGPEFSQQKLIDSLNQVKDFSADGMIVPIDWTIQHNDPRGPGGSEIPKYAGKYICSATVRVKGGKFETVPTAPGKPWVCLKGGPNAPTLTETPDYMSFAPASG